MLHWNRHNVITAIFLQIAAQFDNSRYSQWQKFRQSAFDNHYGPWQNSRMKNKMAIGDFDKAAKHPGSILYEQRTSKGSF